MVVVAILARFVVLSPSATGRPRRRSSTRAPETLVARLLPTPRADETARTKVTNPDAIEGRRLAELEVLVPRTATRRRPVIEPMVDEEARHGQRPEARPLVAPAADTADAGRAPVVRQGLVENGRGRLARLFAMGPVAPIPGAEPATGERRPVASLRLTFAVCRKTSAPEPGHGQGRRPIPLALQMGALGPTDRVGRETRRASFTAAPSRHTCGLATPARGAKALTPVIAGTPVPRPPPYQVTKRPAAGAKP